MVSRRSQQSSAPGLVPGADRAETRTRLQVTVLAGGGIMDQNILCPVISQVCVEAGPHRLRC